MQTRIVVEVLGDVVGGEGVVEHPGEAFAFGAEPLVAAEARVALVEGEDGAAVDGLFEGFGDACGGVEPDVAPDDVGGFAEPA